MLSVRPSSSAVSYLSRPSPSPTILHHQVLPPVPNVAKVPKLPLFWRILWSWTYCFTHCARKCFGTTLPLGFVVFNYCRQKFCCSSYRMTAKYSNTLTFKHFLNTLNVQTMWCLFVYRTRKQNIVILCFQTYICRIWDGEKNNSNIVFIFLFRCSAVLQYTVYCTPKVNYSYCA